MHCTAQILQHHLFLQDWKRCKVTALSEAPVFNCPMMILLPKSKPNRSFRNKWAAGLCKARTPKFIWLYRNNRIHPHCTILLQKYCFVTIFCTVVIHSLPFCAPATKLNIPVSEHFGKLHAPIGIATTSKSNEIFSYLSFCHNHHWSKSWNGHKHLNSK